MILGVQFIKIVYRILFYTMQTYVFATNKGDFDKTSEAIVEILLQILVWIVGVLLILINL